MNLLLKLILLCSRNNLILDSDLVSGVFKKGFLSGCAFLVLFAFSCAKARTSGRKNEDVVFNFWAIPLINSLLDLFTPCLTCNPFNAKL